MITARIIKGLNVLLANPVWLRVTPMTVGEALERNVIDSYELDDSVSPTRAGKLKSNMYIVVFMSIINR